jgi:predicted CXXCH cytochrome family protein
MANDTSIRSNAVKRFFHYILCFMILIAVAACGGGLKDGKSVYNPDKGNVPQLTVDSHKGGNEQRNCFVCHSGKTLRDKHEYNKKLANSFNFLGQSETDTGVCLYCHGENNVIEVITDDSYKCTFCHANPKIVASATLFDGHMQAHAFNGSGKLNNSDCMTCHEFSDMDGNIRYDIDFTKSGTTYASSTEFCLYCHDGSGAFGIAPSNELKFDADFTNIHDTYKGLGGNAFTADIHGAKDGRTGLGQPFGEFRGTYEGSMEISCLSCHEVHTSTNSYMITRFGDSAELADDTARNAQVSVHGNNFTELCALCHYTPGGIPTDNGLVEVRHGSEYDSDCTKCHYHGAGYGDKTDLF